jgi:hypothetical protein
MDERSILRRECISRKCKSATTRSRPESAEFAGAAMAAGLPANGRTRSRSEHLRAFPLGNSSFAKRTEGPSSWQETESPWQLS